MQIFAIITLKGSSHKIFDLWFFSSNNSIWAPDTFCKTFLHMASYLQRYSTLKSIFVGDEGCPILTFLVCVKAINTSKISVV
jgi:hypothetical protein